MESATPVPARTVGDALPWVRMTLDYTEQLAAAIPEELLDWRPTDPTGKFCFSLAEIVMHCADARRMFAGQLSGECHDDEFWSSGPNAAGAWPFKERPDKAALLDSLSAVRALFKPYLERPAEELTAETAGTRAAYRKNMEALKEGGHDTAMLERAGVPNIVRVLFAVAAHEAGHRGSLQTLLRQHGVNLGEE